MTPGSTLGAPSSYTLAGPPERMTPITFRARSSAGITSCGKISQYTRDSRTRRAMSCVYCEPKSRIAMVARADRPPEAPVSGRLVLAVFNGLGPDPVVRSFRRDADVVRVRFAKTGAGDPDEARARAQVFDRPGARVAHARAETADELVHDRRERAECADAALDPLGNELRKLADVDLTVAVARTARFHHAERAHPAIGLESTFVVLDDVSRRLIDAGEESAEHHGPRARPDRLGDVTGMLDAPISADRDPVTVRGLGPIEDRGDLGHPGAGDDPRRTDGARAHPDLDAVGACCDELLGAFGGRDVPGDHLDAVPGLHLFDHPHDGRRVAVCRV